MVFTRASYCEIQTVASLMPTEIVIKGSLPLLATNVSILEVQMLFLHLLSSSLSGKNKGYDSWRNFLHHQQEEGTVQKWGTMEASLLCSSLSVEMVTRAEKLPWNRVWGITKMQCMKLSGLTGSPNNPPRCPFVQVQLCKTSSPFPTQDIAVPSHTQPTDGASVRSVSCVQLTGWSLSRCFLTPLFIPCCPHKVSHLCP